MNKTWLAFSKEISEVVARAGKSIVAVDGRSGHTSSGIVWRSNMILTAAHAIRHEARIGVIFGPDRSVQAHLAGKDRDTDIAVLKLDQDVEAEPMPLGEGTTLSVGDFTVAVARSRRGNIVASAGIISGLMGEWRLGRTRIDQFIRPDLTLYPGFSGGVLLGPSGAVVGMNTSGLVRGRPITIPALTLSRIAEEISLKGHVAQPYVGLVMQPVRIPESVQSRAGVKTQAGLLVMHVEPAGPAERGGVLIGDILTEMDGQSFDDLDDLQQILGRKGIGQSVETVLIRGGMKSQISIQIGERPIR
jgi:S1-C subfamily serine protease